MISINKINGKIHIKLKINCDATSSIIDFISLFPLVLLSLINVFQATGNDDQFLCVIIPVDVWNHIHDVLLPKYSQQLNGLNVMSGPIFDKDFDGNVDPLGASSG